MAVVMVVEDNVKLNAMFSKQLSTKGYTIYSAHSVREAIATVQAGGAPQVIVLDLELGDGDGRQFLDYLYERGIKPRVLVVSGYAYDADFDVSGYEVDSVFAKPVSPRELCTLVGQLI
ncbi:MAG: response regulator [Anaerolineaceae bacterium]|nr:MAG: response regulator [Anaerolineaceae bacterium]